MKNILILSCLICCTISVIAQTKDEDKGDKFLKTEKELNQVYKKVLYEQKDDSVFVKNLKKSQKLWIQFRNAEMEMHFPVLINGHNSTPFWMCYYSFKEKFTRSRINALRVWLNKNYDVCTENAE